MDDTVETAEPVDSRIAALAALTQTLILKYGELATVVAEYVPDNVRAELIDHAGNLMEEARGALVEIAAMQPA